MTCSRRERSREASRRWLRQVLNTAVAMVLCGALVLLCYYRWFLAAAVLMVLFVFGGSSMNYANIRAYVPGLSSRNHYIRWGVTAFYLLAVMILLSQVSLYSEVTQYP